MKLRFRILFILSCSFLVVFGPLVAQSSKTIQEKQIASRTVQEYFIEEGMDEPIIESIERFNANGDLEELKEYNKKGDVKRWEKYAYDENGKLVEEVFLDAKGRIDRIERTIYADGLKQEKQYFNSREVPYKRKVYEYEYRR